MSTTDHSKPATRAPFEELFEKAKMYLPPDGVALVDKAYRFAEDAHRGQMRLSGEPFIEHPLNTALYLVDLHMDASALAAALLHDVVEDCGVDPKALKDTFGHEIGRLVDGVTKLGVAGRRGRQGETQSKGQGYKSIRQNESMRKMLLAMAEDIRVVLIKLADRLHNMKTLEPLTQLRRLAIAQETLDIYAPMAHRLGMWDIKWQLEDLAFRYLQPEGYERVSSLVVANRIEQERYIQQVIDVLQEEFQQVGILAEVTGRPKHLYSVFKKIEKYATRGKDFAQIYDLLAVRVLVNEVQDCYSALGTVHHLWHPLSGQFDDYIANPKENLYQALHTAVMCIGGTPLEIQIRTHEMHRVAEYGVAAHWHYKEGSKGALDYEHQMGWLRDLLKWQRDMTGADEFVETVKMDLFSDQVFIYTPKGEVKELPAGSTSLDFAYRIHTDLGHRCVGAKVNGKLVALNSILQNGDTVEVMTSKVERGPSLDWLNPDLGYIKTASARQTIRSWFRRQEKDANIQQGRELIHREMKRLRLNLDDLAVARLMKMDSAEDVFAALGSGIISIAQVAHRLTDHQAPPIESKTNQRSTGPSSGVHVLGVGDLLTRMAACCSPVPGDDIVGFVTRFKGVTIHRNDCQNVINEDEPERVVSVNWSGTRQLYPARVRLEAWDRVGLLRDVSTLLSAEGVNIASVVTSERADNTCTVDLTLYTIGISQLSRLFSKLEGVEGFISVGRMGNAG